MESARIKENRKAKFLSKMDFNNNIINHERSYNYYNSITYNNSLSYRQNTPENHQVNNFYNNSFQNTWYNSNNNNIDNVSNNNDQNFNSFFQNQQNNSLNNSPNNNYQFQYNQNEPKINFSILLEKLNQLDYMINFQSILKKIFIIILSILHLFNYSPLNNCFIFKYTLFVLEMSSLLFNKYYNEQKKSLTKNNLKQNNNSTLDQPSELIEIITIFFKKLIYFNQFFYIFKFLVDIIIDFSILFIINVLFFLINNED